MIEPFAVKVRVPDAPTSPRDTRSPSFAQMLTSPALLRISPVRTKFVEGVTTVSSNGFPDSSFACFTV